MSKLGKPSKTDIAACRETILRTGEFRVHLAYSRGGNVTARLWHWDGWKVGSADGGGYDKYGTALGQAMGLFLGPELMAIPIHDVDGKQTRETYGLCQFIGSDGKVKRSLDGACGLECMLKILGLMGFGVERYDTGKDSCMVLAKRAGKAAL